MQITRLTPADLPRFRAMNALFSAVFDLPEDYAAGPPDDAYAHALVSRDTFLAFVAEDGPATVGAIAGYILPKYERARSEGYIYDLAVMETHRRRGIATALIRAFATAARDVGATVTFVQADRDDPPAIALYTKLGRREDVHHFDLDL